jgi:hypothetical protein
VGPAVEDLLALLVDEGAAEDPVKAAAAAAATQSADADTDARRTGVGAARLDDVGRPTERPCDSGARLQWDLWHVGSPRGKRDALAFSRLKREVCQLGATPDYAPRKEPAVQRVLEILKETGKVPFSGAPATGEGEEVDEEDEI